MGIFGRLFRSRDPLKLARELMTEARAGNYAAVKSIIGDVMANSPSVEDLAMELLDEHKSKPAILAAIEAGGLADNGTRDLLALGLFEAAAEGHIEIVELLADHGANMDRPHGSDGTTAMGIAAFTGRNDIVQFLTRRAANLNAKDNKGVTPFMLAVAKCSAETVSKMIGVGADLHSESNGGLTVKDFASMPPKADILALLDSAPESGINTATREPGLTAPAAKGGVCVAKYKVGKYVMKVFTDIRSFGPVKFLYILEVSFAEKASPIMYVTCESSDLSPSHELIMGVFDSNGHQNLGPVEGIGKLQMFIARARLEAGKRIIDS